MNKAATFNSILLCCLVIVTAWSLYNPHDYLTWVLEASPVVIGVVVLMATYKRFCFTRFTYFFIFVHMIILLVGAHYTYANVPLFDWFKEWFGWSRNNYDKVGHFAQGFIPALVARELLIRLGVFARRGWQSFFIVCFCLAFSAFYEILEWWAAVSMGGSADSFLGTQGYIWDTQSDMLLALIGAIIAVTVFAHWQDRCIKRLLSH
ncbi:MAG: DUF2238 domain-containing protein [Coxiellaceae bacterium]|nr:DUF2238 domain-containing protein [Coxiellaceae bacterium]